LGTHYWILYTWFGYKLLVTLHLGLGTHYKLLYTWFWVQITSYSTHYWLLDTLGQFTGCCPLNFSIQYTLLNFIVLNTH